MRYLVLQFALLGAMLALLLAVGQYAIFMRAGASSWSMAGFAMVFLGIGAYVGLRRAAGIADRPRAGRSLHRRRTLHGSRSRHERREQPRIHADAPEKRPEERARALKISRREHEVLALIARGLSNQEIGDELHISETTVKSHVSSLLSKLDASRRTHAVRIAKERGILP